MKGVYYSVVLIVICVCIDNIRSQNGIISLYRLFRDEILVRRIGRTINDPKLLQRAKSTGRIQERVPASFTFPCADFIQGNNGSNSNPWKGPRSKERPTSVHALRPGDIDVIAAFGDSLTAGTGAAASNILHLFLENRGVVWSIGGYGTWREYFTLPNMLKVFNPNLIGYSYGDSFAHHRASQFNIAEIVAMSKDLPFQAEELTKRLKNDPRVDMKQDWKMITILIGANDFCGISCFIDNPRDIIEGHFKSLHAALSIIRDNIPRVLVNIVPAPDVSIPAGIRPRPFQCEITLRIECPCMVGDTHKLKRKLITKLVKEWQKIELEIGDLPEFNNKDDFTVIAQPFSKDILIPKDITGEYDMTYFSTDCYHFSQKGHARAANALWNNMFERIGEKSFNWNDLFDEIKCPTEDNPYIFTRVNSVKAEQNDVYNNLIKRSVTI